MVAQVLGRLGPTQPPDAAMEIRRLEDGRTAEHWGVIRPNADFQPGRSDDG